MGDRLNGAGFDVYLLDLPGHGDSTDFYSFPHAEHCVAATIGSLARMGKISPDHTILIGHSMGGAVAIRMADHIPVAATVAISPGPLEFPRRMPSNLLVFSAQYDIPLLKQIAEKLAQAAQGTREYPEDFVQRRAFALERIPRALHVSLIYDSRVDREMIRWAAESLAGPLTSEGIHDEMAAGYAGLFGILLMFPFIASLLARVFKAQPSSSTDDSPFARDRVLLIWTVASFFGVSFLFLFQPLRFLHMLSGDYLAGLLLVSGIVALALNSKAAASLRKMESRSFCLAVLLAFGISAAVGAWLNWQMSSAWPNFPRWIRFFALLPVCWIFSFAEEVLLGPVGRGRSCAKRFMLFLAMRLELWLACMLALFLMGSAQVMLLILVVYLALISVLVRLGSDALRRRSGNAVAAAAFDAILAAWFIATLFPLT
ncbi:MAG: alpha/beta hydrolase [Candidatus Acidiferrales bacterium]